MGLDLSIYEGLSFGSWVRIDSKAYDKISCILCVELQEGYTRQNIHGTQTLHP